MHSTVQRQASPTSDHGEVVAGTFATPHDDSQAARPCAPEGAIPTAIGDTYELFAACELDVPPPAYSPPSTEAAIPLEKPRVASKEQTRHPKPSISPPSAGSSRTTVANESARLQPSQYLQSLSNSFFSDMAASRHRKKIEQQVRALSEEADKAEQRQDFQTVALLGESIDSVCLQHGIDRWSMFAPSALHDKLPQIGASVRRALLRADDQLSAKLMDTLATAMNVTDGRDGPQRSKGKQKHRDIAFERISNLIDSGHTPIRLIVAHDMPQTIRLLCDIDRNNFPGQMVKAMRKNLAEAIGDRDLKGALAHKDRIFDFIRSTNSGAAGTRARNTYNELLSRVTGYNDFEWRKTVGTLLTSTMLGSLDFVAKDISFWKGDNSIWRVPKEMTPQKDWLAIVLALGVMPGQISVEQSRAERVQGSTPEVVIDLSRSGRALSSNLLYLAFLSGCKDTQQMCQDVDWIGNVRPSEWAIKDLIETIENPATREQAIAFLRSYRDRATLGSSGLTHLKWHAEVGQWLPGDLSAWLAS